VAVVVAGFAVVLLAEVVEVDELAAVEPPPLLDVLATAPPPPPPVPTAPEAGTGVMSR
jgi:hypothetical protein